MSTSGNVLRHLRLFFSSPPPPPPHTETHHRRFWILEGGPAAPVSPERRQAGECRISIACLILFSFPPLLIGRIPSFLLPSCNGSTTARLRLRSWLSPSVHASHLEPSSATKAASGRWARVSSEKRERWISMVVCDRPMGGRWDGFLGLGHVVRSDIKLDISAVRPPPRCGLARPSKRNGRGDEEILFATTAANVDGGTLTTRPVGVRSMEGPGNCLSPLSPSPAPSSSHASSVVSETRAKIPRIGV
ncbi:hypothetical protein B0T18DRAFT_228385 [Schizothecium vesticola]|uniref:Uncharacterized protein n=1 Tax=Schizothecium vesticola TaxID=314040 RepID=A0AA40EL03_9PEZI|nr:hypothetical protein B0T18DRAFT_228385 [Schizothecium vesticola]